MSPDWLTGISNFILEHLKYWLGVLKGSQTSPRYLTQINDTLLLLVRKDFTDDDSVGLWG